VRRPAWGFDGDGGVEFGQQVHPGGVWGGSIARSRDGTLAHECLLQSNYPSHKHLTTPHDNEPRACRMGFASIHLNATNVVRMRG